MKTIIRKKIKKIGLVLMGLFALMFVFRLIYGYQTVTATQTDVLINLESNIDFNTRKNYASMKYKVGASQASLRIDQKYEKIADIKTYSTAFDADETAVRDKVIAFDGLIQFENKSGNSGYRQLDLVIGVPPEHFDSIYQNLVKIGNVQAKQITKTDKTNEYKELNAKKASLEKIRESLINLKEKGGKIEEFMQLENRILEIEQQLQELGVSLGNFDDENEFCTVKVTLSEGRELHIGLMQRLKVALEWTVKYYLMLMVGLCFMSLCAYLTALATEKLKSNLK